MASLVHTERPLYLSFSVCLFVFFFNFLSHSTIRLLSLAVFQFRFVSFTERQLIAHFMQCWIGCVAMCDVLDVLCVVMCVYHLFSLISSTDLELWLFLFRSTHWHHHQHHRYSCDKWQPISLVTTDRLLTSHCLQVDAAARIYVDEIETSNQPTYERQQQQLDSTSTGKKSTPISAKNKNKQPVKRRNMNVNGWMRELCQCERRTEKNNNQIAHIY